MIVDDKYIIQLKMNKKVELQPNSSPSLLPTFEMSTMPQSANNNSNLSGVSTSSINQRPRYGNMIVLFQNDRFLITLGPDCTNPSITDICFIIAMISFSVLYYFTISAIASKVGWGLFGIGTVIGAVLQLLSYLIIAISNPGVITQSDFDTEEQDSKMPKRFCNVCNQQMLPRSRHCSQCNVCIKGYDHHCPWTSKCIGQNNLYRFYFFACYTPFFLVYCALVLAFV